ncbi:VWA domain-containing protein [Paucihalobacter ruber]|uniref:VWA domain-containing protein n=1 Tax=Paucihalobacter ruber TaxID=2567861 RepID=A0A506PPE2_9FLAO|nr:VWA domain-containing protein [Paucihalobacter ruber]TPV35057.1 VWA domain-containing protein [Paucihalobacter ruber]
MFQLEEKIWITAFAIIPIMGLVFMLFTIWKSKRQKKFAEARLLDKLSPNRSLFKSILKFMALAFAIAFIIIALINPKIGTKLETVRSEGIDIVFAVDVSKSMLAEDIAPNRLEKSRQLVSQIINSLVSDRIGIIAYAGKAFPQLPITTDYAAGKLFLQGLNTDMISSQGTAISEAIELSRGYFSDSGQTNKVLIIISDGEDHGEISAAEAANKAVNDGIKIITIGVGDVKGGPIPIKRNGVVLNYKTDQNGETVITKLDEENLKAIAASGNGIYLNGRNTASVVESLKEVFDNIEKTEFESQQVADFKDQFQWFLGIGFALLFIDIFLLERKTAWLRKLNLFNENI